MNTFVKVLLAIVIVAGAILIEGAIAMLLWNWVIVALFGAETISFELGCGIALILLFIKLFFNLKVNVNDE